MTTSLIRAVVVVALVAWIAGCGGGGNDPAPGPGEATIGSAGGTALGGDGAQVVFPKDALRSETTVRIAKDSTGAPTLPAGAAPAGAVYMITPHGETFAVHAEVSIPVDVADIADNQQLLLVTAEPGDTQWRVLSGATYGNGVLRAPVMHFSLFQAIILTNLSMPSLVTTLDGTNNVGGAGIGRLAPDFEFNQDSPLQYYGGVAHLQAKLSFPASPLSVRSGSPQPPPPRACMPTSLSHTAAAWRFLRAGTQAVAPDVVHQPIVQGAESSYPRFENEISREGLSTLYAVDSVPGFGAVHVYGQDTPRRGAFAPTGSTDVWALPPAGNIADNDLLTWSGYATFEGEKHNGRMRIETTIATDCDLSIEAVPISFQLNLASRIPAWDPYTGVQAVDAPIYVANGLTAVMPFVEEFNGTTLSIAWEFSHDAVNWEKLPVPAQYIRDDGPTDYFHDRFPNGHNYSIVIPNAQPAQAGWYRAWACSKPIAADPPHAALPSLCVSKAPAQLVILTEKPTVTAQPASQIVQVGQTASFTAGFTVGYRANNALYGDVMDYTIKWQKRGLVEAAFGLGTWTDIAGADRGTYTTPLTTVNDTATLYRAVATSVLGSTASDAALLTVVEQLAPPVVQSQPGNLNVSVGGSAMFAATVSGTAPLSYQWRRDGANLIGANAAILTLASVSPLDAGRYDLVVTNRAGSVTSEPAALVVIDGTPMALAPTIAAPPASISVAEGNTANFAVSVNGTGPYTYLWMKNGVQAPIPNGDTASFGIASVSAGDAGTYSVRVTNSVGTVVSAAATLTVTAGSATPVAPSIGTQPTTLVVTPGAAATLAIAASGSGPLSYQWFRNGTPVNGATGAVLHLASVSSLDVGTYTVAVSNSAGSVGSNTAQLILVGAPAITTQPINGSVVEGGAATFTVGATGDALHYQWTRNQVAIAGATSASYATSKLTLADSGAVYGVIVYNGAGLVFSQSAVLSVTPAPVLIGGTVSGLTAAGLVLQNNGGDNLKVAANAISFSFETPIANGSTYSVSILAQPAGQTCTLQNASGTASAAVSNIALACVNVSTGPGPLVATAMATGYGSSLVVASDGTVWAWGYLVDPATGGYKSSSPWATTPVQVQGLAGVKAVSVSAEASSLYALHTDGTVSAWGLNTDGQLGDRTVTARLAPVKVMMDATTPMNQVCAITASAHILAMLRQPDCNGTAAVAWIAGWFSGSLTGGDTSSSSPTNGAIARAVPGMPAGVGVKSLTAPHSANAQGGVLFLLEDRRWLAWGSNSSNQLGAGSANFAGGVNGPTDVTGHWEGPSRVELGRTFSLAFFPDDALLISAGGDLNGELGNGTGGGNIVLMPGAVTDFSAGQVSAAAITAGQLWAWGWNGNSAVESPKRVGTGSGFTSVSVGDIHSLAIGPNGEVYSWGDSSYGALGRSGTGSNPAVVMRP
ncbi:MAG: immunoglobulin domain-containing protein [Rhizobacter sp.]